MRPQFVFAIVFVALLGGTLVSRSTSAGGLTAAAHADDSASSAGNRPFVDSSVAFVRLKGDSQLGDGEFGALQAISKALAKSPDMPTAIEWTEAYHGHEIRKQAIYLPQQAKLRCSDDRRGHYEYQPVTPAGIDAAIADGDHAPFANANLFSLPRNQAERNGGR